MLKVNKKDFNKDMRVRIVKGDWMLCCCHMNTSNTSIAGDFNIEELDYIERFMPQVGDELEIVKVQKNNYAKVFFKVKDAEPILVNNKEAIFYAFWCEFKENTELIGPAPVVPKKKLGNRINSFEVVPRINNDLIIRLNIDELGECLLVKTSPGSSTRAVNSLRTGRVKLNNGDDYTFEFEFECINDNKKRMTRKIAMDIINHSELRAIIIDNIIQDIREWNDHDIYHKIVTDSFFDCPKDIFNFYNTVGGKVTGFDITAGNMIDVISMLEKLKNDMSIKIGTDPIEFKKGDI